MGDLRLTIGRRLTPKPVKVRADVEVKCFAYQGIEAIKKALAAGEACSTDDVAIKIRLVAPPLYVMSTTSTDKTAAIDVMEKAVERIGEVISEEKGDMVVKMAVSPPLSVSWQGVRTTADLPPSPRSSRRRTMPSSRHSWINSKRQTWMSPATTIRTRTTSRVQSRRLPCRIEYSLGTVVRSTHIIGHAMHISSSPHLLQHPRWRTAQRALTPIDPVHA